MTQLLLTGTSASTNANLSEALLLVEDRLATWSSNQGSFNDLLRQAFGVPPSTSAKSAALLASIQASGLGISVQILDATTMDGLIAAYTSAAPDDGERIYLNAAWLELATAEQIEAVLLEELGHAIDRRLNGSADTAGDEGAIFSALLRGESPDPAAYRDNDQRILILDGIAVAVEASLDTTRPTGSLFRATAPAFSAAVTNPFGIQDVGISAAPAFADADRDGDLDLFIGNEAGNTLFFRNTAAPEATTPAYAAADTNPFGITNVGDYATPAFADADGDGDLDLFIGNDDGNTLFFRNNAAAGATTPAYAAAATNPFGLIDVGRAAKLAFADADADGDLDLFIGEFNGGIDFFRNTAAPGATTPAFAAPDFNPFGFIDLGDSASPAFADADGDGDLDLFIGEAYGNTLFFRNTAAPGSTAPAYAAGVINPFGITEVDSIANPAFADADNDGDLDLFIGNFNGDTLFFRNTAATPVAPVESATADGTYGIGDVIDITVSFSEAVFVDTTGGNPTLQLETGTIDRKAIFVSGSGSTTLTFQYTVQAGDISADLDQLSSTALELNGGTIADAAGNNAILTLAEPGEAGSLGDNADLVIDTTRPTGSQGSFATAPAFSAAEINPFGIENVDFNAAPAFADADNDGDLDLFIGNLDGDTLFFRNTAAPGSTTPAYATAVTNPFGITNVGSFAASPAFADADGDGDLDLFVGQRGGNALFFRNTAASGATTPAFAAAEINPFGITNVGLRANPAFTDADGDGDLDLFIGNKDGDIFFFRNTAAPGSTEPEFAAAETNPFGITEVGFLTRPAFADADNDGDLDLFISNGGGNTLFFRNTAAPGSTNPAYAAAVTNPFGITNIDSTASPAFADADGDGDLDLFIGNSRGNILFFLNTAATPVAPVASTTANGSYGIGDVIDITVSFSEAVVVDTTGGTPTLQLETGPIDRKAIFESGSGSSTLTFRYTVQEGDTSADLDQLSSTALELNGGSIADAAGNNAILTLAEPGAQGSLGANAALVIDGVLPTVTGVDSTTADGTYGIGDVIDITVALDEVVFVTGTPTLQLETGSTDRKAIFESGSGSSTLTFRYTVQEGDTSADLDQLSSTALELNGGSIADAAGNNAILTLADPGAAGSLSADAALVIDTIRPTGSQGSFATAPAFATAVTNPFGITGVAISAAPAFADADNDGDLDLFIGNEFGDTLFFRNTAAEGATVSAYAAAVTNPFGITDVGDFASPAFADADGDGDLDLFIGNKGEIVFFRNTAALGATSPAYAASENNPFGIGNVGFFPSPAFADADNDGDLDLFIGGKGGDTLFFRNTAAPGATTPAFAAAEINPFGITNVGLRANPAFTDADNDGDLDLFIGSGNGDTVFFRNTAAPDSTTPAYATAVTNPFGITDVDEASPAFADADNDGDLDLFIGGKGGDTVFFLNTAATPVAPVDSATADGTYGIGAVIDITVSFSEPVVVDTSGGTPTLQLETGTIDRKAIFVSGSGSTTLTFRYIVQEGDTSADLDQLSSTALELNGGTIADAAGNSALLNLPNPGATGSLSANKNLVIDGIAPFVSRDTRIYVLEATNPFGISDVGLSAKPTFADIDDDSDLDLFIGNRDGNTLFFRNTAAAGSTAPAYATAASNPFGLSDVGRAASPTLADIDGDGDLDLFIGNRGGNTLFFRNTAAPGSSDPDYSQERGANGAPNPFGITGVGRFAKPSFADADNDGDLDLFIGNLRGNTLFFRNTAAAGSTAPAYAQAATNPFGINDVGLSASPAFTDIDGDGDLDLFIGNRDGNTLVFRNTAAPGSSDPAYSQERGANGAPNPFGITDVGFNASPAFADADGDGDTDLFIGNAAGNTLVFRNTGAAPGVNSSTVNGVYTTGAVINLTIGFSEPVFVDTTGGTPTLQLETGSIDRKAIFISGSGSRTLTFQYIVQDGDSSPDLAQLSSSALELNGGSISDANGNPAILVLPQPGTPGSLSANADLIIDTNDVIASTIRSSESLTLPDGIANLILTGTANINGRGNDLDNRLEGNAGKNRLNGKAGSDTLIGKEEKDRLTGGSDADIFLFQSINDSGITNATRDQITDFTADDTIDLSRIDADPNTIGDQAFVFIGSDRFTDIGQARFSNAVLRLNIDDDLFADFQINLKGVSELSTDSLIL
ncbi:beta strand repeat-containing protein [Synechococcus sp. A10-1-5-9]|uniref:beta strand repeat-containing protein n=1 Tax=Synechococcus sp. A10-1-5-9 TaxID=3392295 RepID=UPI0039E8E61A